MDGTGIVTITGEFGKFGSPGWDTFNYLQEVTDWGSDSNNESVECILWMY